MTALVLWATSDVKASYADPDQRHGVLIGLLGAF